MMQACKSVPTAGGAIIAVTGSQRPYIYDLPHLLSLPDGFEFRFRYRHSWVEQGLRQSLSENESAFDGRTLIICFHSQESRRLVPIRKATIIGIEKIGPMILLRFRVGAFVNINLDLSSYSFPKAQGDTPNEAATRAADLLSHHAAELLGPIGGVKNYDLADPLPSGWYLREAATAAETLEWDNRDPAAAWARTVAVLHGDKNLFGLPFFYLLGFRTETGDTVSPSAIENRFSPSRERIYGFALKELQRYRMRILEWCERPKTATDPRIRLNCEYQQSHLALEGGSNLVVGRYDIVEFTFSAQRPGYSEVGLRADPLNKQESNHTKVAPAAMTADATTTSVEPAGMDWPTVFAARVPVVVRPRSRTYVAATVATALGLGLYLWVAPGLSSSPRRQGFVQLVALGILLWGCKPFGEFLERLLKLGTNMRKASEVPEKWGAGGS